MMVDFRRLERRPYGVKIVHEQVDCFDAFRIGRSTDASLIVEDHRPSTCPKAVAMLRSAIQPFEVPSSPETDGLGNRQHRAAVIGEGVQDRSGNAPRPTLMNDSVGDQLAQLLRQYLSGDARHEPAQLQKLPRRFGEPVDDDQLPLAAHRRERGGQWTSGHRIPSSPARSSYFKVPSSDHWVSFVRMPR